jgi:hypothetical protein
VNDKARGTITMLGAMLVTSGCGSSVAPTETPPLVTLSIEASASCQIGDGGLPLRSYVITMRDERSGNDWLFMENRDPGGPREQSLMLRLELASGSLLGNIQGPAIIAADAGRMTVFPDGTVSATATPTGLTGTFSGRLAAWLTDGGTVQSCTATDHKIRLPLVPSR